MVKKKPSKPTEKAIETAILKYLSFLRNCFAWKNNSGGVYDAGRGTFRANKNKFVINGVADILGVYDGRLLAIEVKRPGGKVSEAQKKFIDKVIKMGGIAGVCYSVDDARELIKSAGGKHVNSNTEGVSE